ncbi:hypothetical protein [Pseudomonas gingeri]|uniref:Uncharacterized protein n=1 Tax=Pseudomonas gingeri TaxID=117681 RepID=A0A7Y8CLZ4_9PSED|nr:hypothetical protein [Pseudomonas gingeri]NWB29179.1 hypothetical protein [Pseudomonas gingeri]NWC34504.1 hypothetical protein [Pseudomonas gingeri]NWD06681.1 hypothetical protein [Pseudomonas gingeri]NWD49293.1 hypothetical protein [Pseudomonas gingeri]NWE33039.1 hypothetical protein [Pseudomonas gingeri]
MTGFTHGKKTLSFGYTVGEVLDSEKFSQTQVSSSGGGGHIGEHGGNVRPVRIQSTSIINHEFWIREDSGQEKDIKLVGYDIPLRAGQRVSMVMVADLDASKLVYSALVNHSAGKSWILKDADAMDKFFGLTRFNYKALLIAVAVWIVVGLLSLGVLGFFAACGTYGYQYWRGRQRRKRMLAELDEYQREAIDERLSEEEERSSRAA